MQTDPTVTLSQRIEARRDNGLVMMHRSDGMPMSSFMRRLREKRLPVKTFYAGAFVPDRDGGAA